MVIQPSMMILSPIFRLRTSIASLLKWDQVVFGPCRVQQTAYQPAHVQATVGSSVGFAGKGGREGDDCAAVALDAARNGTTFGRW